MYWIIYIFCSKIAKIALTCIAEESENAYSKGCAHLQCENGSRCIKRRFSCRDPPCPGMLYCSKSRQGDIPEKDVSIKISFYILSYVNLFVSHFFWYLFSYSIFLRPINLKIFCINYVHIYKRTSINTKAWCNFTYF